ncbi:MAG: DNA polymerase III subunit epsilon, partial [Pseudomonadota bacterium]
RVIELGAVELVNHVPTGKTFRTLINPGRPVSDDTIRITGITDEMLVDKPTFDSANVIDAFLGFIGDATLVAHNAAFDRGFLNAELKRCGRAIIEEPRWVDTVALAKKRFPGAPASLDALCKRFDVSLESRTFHGALLDAQLLAAVYLELLGGRARAFDFSGPAARATVKSGPARQRPVPLSSALSAEETDRHAAHLAQLADTPIWKKYLAGSDV